MTETETDEIKAALRQATEAIKDLGDQATRAAKAFARLAAVCENIGPLLADSSEEQDR